MSVISLGTKTVSSAPPLPKKPEFQFLT